MNELPRQKLHELIATYGRSVCDDPRRCEALLRDYCAGHKREIHVLVNALKERVAADLLSSQNGAPYEVQFARLTKRLRDNLGLAGDAAAWAVESWAVALGVVEVPRQDSKPAGEKSPTQTTSRASKKRTPQPVRLKEIAPTTDAAIVEREKKPQFSSIRVTDRRASSSLSKGAEFEPQPSYRTATSSAPQFIRPALSDRARLVFTGLFVLAGILVITGAVVAVPEMMRGDDPDETTLYIWIPAMFLLSMSLVGLLPNVRFRTFLLIATAFFVSGALVALGSEYLLHQNAPYWADVTTVTGPFSIVGVLVGFGISKFIARTASTLPFS